MSELVQKLRDRKQAIAWSRGQDTDYPTKWEPDALCQKAADELERMRGEQAVLVRLLLEADKVVSTIEGECQEEWDQLADLRRAIAAATIPHRPEEADLLSLRACIGA
jgi:hypothetical protein